MATSEERRRLGSQAKLPSLLFWVLAAAVVFRIVTALIDRAGNTAQSGLVRWQASDRVSAQAQRTGKPILYDFTAQWCVPCRWLDSEGWGDSKIAALVNEFYLPTRVVDRQREEGRNSPAVESLHRHYAVAAFPTLVIASADGREIARAEGYRGRQVLREFLEESRKKAGVAPSAPVQFSFSVEPSRSPPQGGDDPKAPPMPSPSP